MAINFTKNIEQYTTINRGTRTKQFTEFTSKKQLRDAAVLSDKAYLFATSIKGTFSFALHNEHRYMAVTIYRATAEKKYSFLVLDLQEQAIAEVGSIKEAKAEILEIVKAAEVPAEQLDEEEEQPVEEPVEDLENSEELAGIMQNIVEEALNEEAEEPAKKDKKNRNKNA